MARKDIANPQGTNAIGVVCSALVRLWWRFVRLKYRLATFRDYGARLNRSVDVESELMRVASGKRGSLTPDECRELAHKLGVPECYRGKANAGAVAPPPKPSASPENAPGG